MWRRCERKQTMNATSDSGAMLCGATIIVSPEAVRNVPSLVTLCSNVVVASLERYHPEAFSVLSEDDFEQLVRLRHKRTQPKEGSGGVDGTGRVAPAVSEKFMSEVEEVNPHLADSAVVDQIVWKDCVNYRFRDGGLTRPRALTLPWPLLVERITSNINVLLQSVESTEIDAAIQTLEDVPMSIELLQATGAGKSVKKVLKLRKASQPTASYERLDKLLFSWKAMAEQNGVVASGSSPSKADKVETPYSDDREDMLIAAKCLTWRQLFHALKLREDTRIHKQGERMREIRRNLASDRPKVVKVRPTSAKHARILARPHERRTENSPSLSSAGSKIAQLRKESAVQASRQWGVNQPSAMQLKRPPATPSASSFGAAVAFAASAKRTSSNKKAKTMHVKLAGGKQMNIPTKIVQGAGPRQLAPTFKSVRRNK